jgi:hypothetical protein
MHLLILPRKQIPPLNDLTAEEDSARCFRQQNIGNAIEHPLEELQHAILLLSRAVLSGIPFNDLDREFARGSMKRPGAESRIAKLFSGLPSLPQIIMD